MRRFEVFSVKADPVTGEWLSDPISTGVIVDEDDWWTHEDTKEVHYDTYEHHDEGDVSGTTRAITVTWAPKTEA